MSVSPKNRAKMAGTKKTVDVDQRQDEAMQRKELQKWVLCSLEAEKLREAQASGDVELVRKAIHDYQDRCGHGDSADPDVLASAHDTLEILVAKEDLKRAMKSNNIRHIDEELTQIKEGKLHRHMQPEVQEAERKIEQLGRQQRGYLLSLNRNTMCEMRRYHSPQPIVHKVMQAAFLLVKEGEYKTYEWKYCCQLLNPQGEKSLLKKLIVLDVDAINPEIAARAREILMEENMKLSNIQKVSSGAATFYVWAMGMVDEVLGPANKGRSDQGPYPADADRQKQIFQGYPGSPRRSPKAKRKVTNTETLPKSSTQVHTYSLDDPPRNIKPTPPYPGYAQYGQGAGQGAGQGDE